MAPEDLDNEYDDLDLDAAIGAAEDLVGAVDGTGMDLDEVLNAQSDADLAVDGPRTYDFNRPHNISRTFEQNLQSMAENFAKTGGIDFTSLLRMTASIDYKGLQQCTFGEYLEELPNPTCASMVTLAPLKGYSLLHIDLGLCFVFMKKLMGGAPVSEDTVREFTEIERGINAGLVERFLEILRKSAMKLVRLDPGFVGLENNPNYLSGIAEGESLIIMKFQVKLDTVEGPVEIAIPLPAFGPVRDVFDPQDAIELRTPSELREDRRKILDMVRTTGSELVVNLGEISATLEDVLSLAVGDLIHLPQVVDAPLKVHIEGQEAWLGDAGRVGQHRAVKLIQQLNKE
ncbi:FliM/FliN family flagellar motor switch protein [bacterium]|nr:FliM/FliN family flagellar motor switch protein [bacterium]